MGSEKNIESGVSPVYTAAYDSIRKGAPGLSDATCAAIARSINMKVSLAAAPSSLGESVLKPLRYAVENEKAHWSLSDDTEVCVDVQVDDLRAILSAAAKATGGDHGPC